MKVQSEINSQKRTTYSKSAAGLLPGSHQADIRMRSHRLLQLDDNKSTAKLSTDLMQVDSQDFISTSLIQVV